MCSRYDISWAAFLPEVGVAVRGEGQGEQHRGCGMDQQGQAGCSGTVPHREDRQTKTNGSVSFS